MPGRLPALDQWERWCDEGIDVLNEGVKVLRLLRQNGPDILALARTDPYVGNDGYGQSVLTDASGSSEYTPTERAALAAYPEPLKDEDDVGPGPDARVALPVDPIATTVGRLLEEMTVLRREALPFVRRHVERVADYDRRIAHRGDGRSGRQSTVTECLLCLRWVSGVGTDRIRSGYCPACYMAWWRWVEEHGTESDPIESRRMFEGERRKKLAEPEDVASIPPEVAGGTLLAEQLKRKGA